MSVSTLLIFFVQLMFCSFVGCGTLSAQTQTQLTAGTCSEKNVELKDHIFQARQCQSDSDCSETERILSCHFTPCYGYPVNKTADVKDLEVQLLDYEASCSSPLMCACPPKVERPKCISGVCDYSID